MPEKTIIRFPKGADRKEEKLSQISIPDLWHTAMLLQEQGLGYAADQVLETWHLTHDLLNHLKGEDPQPAQSFHGCHCQA